MATSIAKLAIQFVADASGLKAGVKGAESALTGFVGKANAIGGKLAGAFGFVSGSAALLGFVASVKQSFQQLDDLAKLSTKLGVPVEQLQLLDHAASLSGVSAEMTARSFARMNDTIGEGVRGTKSAIAAFRMLGLNADDLSRKSPEQAFIDIADALNKIPNQAQRTTVAMDIFGRSAVDILPLLAEGREGINKLFSERRELGLFNRAELARVEEANDAWDTMLTSIKQISGEIAINLAPAMKDFAVTVKDLAPTLGKILRGTGTPEEGTPIQQAAGKYGEALMTGDAARGREGIFDLFNMAVDANKAVIRNFTQRPKGSDLSPEKLKELGQLGEEMQAALESVGEAQMSPEAERAALEASLRDLGIGPALDDPSEQDFFPAGPEADKLFGNRIAPAIDSAFAFLKKADVKLSAAIANTVGEESFTGDALGTAAKAMEMGVEKFAEVSTAARKNMNELAATPAIGSAAALQKGTAAAFATAQANAANQQRAEEMRLQEKQAKHLEKIERNTSVRLDEFKTVIMN